MIKQRLHAENVQAAMVRKGLSQAGLAKKIDVSREAVSQWLSGKSSPRPHKLLSLGKLLGLSFQDLVRHDDKSTPVVAFRKYRSTKVSAKDLDKARNMGWLLRNLVEYLPFDLAVTPPHLKEPALDYDYVQRAAERVRKQINLGPGAFVDVWHLVRHFKDLQAVIIPVLWGSERGSARHANATHIYLPDSQTTWVYLNLDTHSLDFKFWMAHELGHCLAPGESEELEKFADAFAGALLFPHADAEELYGRIHKRSLTQQLAEIKAVALERRIAPYTVCKQLEAFAGHANHEKLDFGARVHIESEAMNQALPRMSEHILGQREDVDTAAYLEKASQFFDTPFFEALGEYLRKSDQGAGFVEAVMDIPLLDAKSLFDKLT